jgi:crossover junction endodeoxyribonuclease RuvC
MTGLTGLPIRDRMLSTVSARAVIGIDIGLTGGIAVVDENGMLVDVHDMPVLRDGPVSRRSINGPLLAELLARSHATMAFVEHVGVRPGIVEGALSALSIPTSFIAAPSWKRAVGIAPGKAGAKDAARAEAIRRWPDKGSLFERVRDDGRAEAALIAVAGLMKQQTPR